MISLNYNIVVEMVIFLIMLFVLSRYLIKPILAVVDAREEKINSMRQNADALNSETESKIEEYESRMADARRQASEEKEKIKKAALSEEEEMLKKTRTGAADTIADLRQRIAGEYKEASRKLREESDVLSRNIAERILGRSLN